MKRKTTYQALEELNEALDDFILELAKSLKIPELCNWLTDRINKLKNSLYQRIDR